MQGRRFTNFFYTVSNQSLNRSTEQTNWWEVYDFFCWYFHEIPLNLVSKFFIGKLTDFDFIAFWYLDVYRPFMFYIYKLGLLWYKVTDFLAYEGIDYMSGYLFQAIWVLPVIYISICMLSTTITVIKRSYSVCSRMIASVLLFFLIVSVKGITTAFAIYRNIMFVRIRMQEGYYKVYYDLFIKPIVILFSYAPYYLADDVMSLKGKDYQYYATTMDKYLHQGADDDEEEEDEEQWLDDERTIEKSIRILWASQSNFFVFLGGLLLVFYSKVSYILLRLYGSIVYSDRFSELNYDRGRDGLDLTPHVENWIENCHRNHNRMSGQYFAYKWSFHNPHWYYSHLDRNYTTELDLVIPPGVIDMIDDLMWDCTMPCVIVGLAIVFFKNFGSDFGDHIYTEEVVDYILCYFAFLVEESLSTDALYNTITTGMLDTQCNVDYIGLETINNAADYYMRVSHARKTLTYYFQFKVHMEYKRYHGYITFWEPGKLPARYRDYKRLYVSLYKDIPHRNAHAYMLRQERIRDKLRKIKVLEDKEL